MFNQPLYNNGIRSNRNLLAWWKLQTNLKDFSGNGYDLSVSTGSVPFVIIAGKQCAGTFAGGNLALPAALLTVISNMDTSIMTVEAEVYTNPALTPSQEIFDLRDGGSGAIICDIRFGTNSQSAYLAPPGAAFSSTNVVPTNTWSNLSWVSNGTGSIFYTDKATPFGSAVFPNIGTIAAAKIGNDAGGSGAFPFLGYLRNIKVWSQAVSPPFPTLTT